ncbi:hypothetical protein CHS0354_007661 [Potamilus streckersoni]|uniref:Metalloendopeptidase n=1 Tax=Potamilus streckersoni TaxID=2493646 RepID=A0AAE0VVS8_9BIVA|nr:hypothetical protein CHS0354_007661 [Potamilus streckersoni]
MTLAFVVLLTVFLPSQGLPVEDDISGRYDMRIVDSIHGSPKLNTNHVRVLSGQKLSQIHQPSEGLNDVEGTYEADMKLKPLQESEIMDGVHALDGVGRSKRKVVNNLDYVWPKGIVVFKFNDLANVLPNDIKKTVRSAIENWERTTCIRFLEMSEGVKSQVGHSNYVIFSKGAGCSSYVGMVNDGPQEITISENCNNVVSIAHEIGHSLGFYHEQSRPDRDYFVNIINENIKPGFEGDFKKYDRQTINTREMYDVGSAMHYGPTWFSKDNNAHTIEPKDKGLMGIMGQRDELSFIDIKTANELYKCNAGCPARLDCKNEGYIGPNCTCVCPYALSGKKCEEVKRGTPGCGGILTETSGTFSSPNFPGNYAENADCYWLIQATPKSDITVRFDTFEVEDDGSICSFDWLEIRKYGVGLSGPKVCTEKHGSETYLTLKNDQFIHIMSNAIEFQSTPLKGQRVQRNDHCDQLFCGNGPSAPIVYSGPALILHFHSDEHHTFKGFRATYTITPK